jgi:hypothetical protein
MSNQATSAVLSGAGFYRLFDDDPVLGRLYEIQQSCRALVIGPESDFDQYDVYYLDPIAPHQIQRAILTPDRPWVAPVNVDLVGGYPSEVPGKPSIPGGIFVTPSNQFATFVPGASPPYPNRLQVSARVDILAYTGTLPPILPKRARRLLQATVGLSGTGENPLYFPVYGRRSYDVFVGFPVGGAPANSVDVTINGIVLGVSEGDYAPIELMSATTISTAGTPRLKFYYDVETSGSLGRFDLLEVILDNTNVLDPWNGKDQGLDFRLELAD